ncbi:MAG: DNA translocase FtsK 4TM domain-containing protein [Chloroflexota bacterium]|nr:DNA translocase FtsK 4TM domain-containing protein [Chloroflexota bacterium]
MSQDGGFLVELWLGILYTVFGAGAYVIPLALAFSGLWILVARKDDYLSLPWSRVTGAIVCFICGLALAHLFVQQPQQAIGTRRGGGYVGYGISAALSLALGKLGAVILLITGMSAGLIATLEISLDQLIQDSTKVIHSTSAWLARRRAARAQATEARQGTQARGAVEAPPERREKPPPSPPKKAPPPPPAEPRTIPIEDRVFHRWELPDIGGIFIEREEEQIDVADIRKKTRIIEKTLMSFGVPASVVEVNPGPVVTQFGLAPGYIERRGRDGEMRRAKVKVSHISRLAKDLALALAASPVRVEAPVPGKAIVGLEVPNKEPAIVDLLGVMASDAFRAIASSHLAIGLGRDVSGTPVVDDIGTLPHLLIAGATGSGKSVCINAMIACLLSRNTPADLRLLLIDPKRVELSRYNGTPHLLSPVITDVEEVVGVLDWITQEMERRYKTLAGVGARNIQSYNALAGERGMRRLPFIVAFIDELADLMLAASEQVERMICRIAQMARATGIHLVIATQRPSVDVVTGTIKANFPARISFAVSSMTDSRVVLDRPGAETLLGEGDGLYMAPDTSKLVRMQGCYVSDEEISRLVRFWKDQAARRAERQTASRPMALESLQQEALWPSLEEKEQAMEEDPLLERAMAFVATKDRASLTMLQKQFHIGYTRAGRIMDAMEERGVVGPPTGTSKARRVLSQSTRTPRPHD